MRPLALIALLVGCGPEPVDNGWWQVDGCAMATWASVPIRIAAGVTGEKDIRPLRDSVKFWNNSTGLRLFDDPVVTNATSAEPGMVIVVRSELAYAYGVDTLGNTGLGGDVEAGGRCVSTSAFVEIDDDVGSYALTRSTISHELGHVLGLAHDTVEGSIMTRSIDRAGTGYPTQSDIDLLWSAYSGTSTVGLP